MPNTQKPKVVANEELYLPSEFQVPTHKGSGSKSSLKLLVWAVQRDLPYNRKCENPFVNPGFFWRPTQPAGHFFPKTARSTAKVEGRTRRPPKAGLLIGKFLSTYPKNKIRMRHAVSFWISRTASLKRVLDFFRFPSYFAILLGLVKTRVDLGLRWALYQKRLIWIKKQGLGKDLCVHAPKNEIARYLHGENLFSLSCSYLTQYKFFTRKIQLGIA